VTFTEKIIPLLSEANNSQISRVVGCSREMVRLVRNREGIESPFKHIRCVINQEESMGELLRLAHTNLSWREIAVRVGLSVTTVRKRVRDAGLNIKKPYRTGVKIPKATVVEALENTDYNFRLAAEKLNISYMTIWRYGKMYDIKPKGWDSKTNRRYGGDTK
jgi:transposase